MIKNTQIGKNASDLFGKLFAWLPLEPTAVTIMSVLFAFFGFILYLASHSNSVVTGTMAFVFFLLAFAFDAVDGAIARAKNMVTKEGAFIDGISDRIVEFFIILTIMQMLSLFPYTGLIPEAPFVLAAILFFGTCMSSFVTAYSEHRGVLKHEDAVKLPGILERAERGMLLLVVFILLVFGYAQYAVYVLYLTAMLSFVTFAQRVWAVLHNK